MSARRRYISDRRADSAHRDLSSVTLVERGPEEGRFDVYYHPRLRCYLSKLRFRGGVYSGQGQTGDEARRSAVGVAAELTKLTVEQVEDEIFLAGCGPATHDYGDEVMSYPV